MVISFIWVHLTLLKIPVSANYRQLTIRMHSWVMTWLMGRSLPLLCSAGILRGDALREDVGCFIINRRHNYHLRVAYIASAYNIPTSIQHLWRDFLIFIYATNTQAMSWSKHICSTRNVSIKTKYTEVNILEMAKIIYA